jgi:hypothetical protein
MRCSKVRSLVAESVLGDLDAELERAVREHLEGCAECRGTEGALARTVKRLQAPAGLSPSHERRDLAVAAMLRAHADQTGRGAGAPRRAWLGSLSLAAVFFLSATTAVVLMRPGGAAAFPVVKVAGQADRCHRPAGVWQPLAAGEVIYTGDRVVTQGECIVQLDLGPGTVTLDQNTSVELVSGSRIALDRGRLLVELHGRLGEPFVVTDTANNSAFLRDGRMEVSLRGHSTLLAGYMRLKGDPEVLPESREQTVWRLAVRVEAGEAYLAGSHDQRLRAVTGQDGSFSPDGQPSTSATLPGSIKPWVDLGVQEKK